MKGDKYIEHVRLIVAEKETQMRNNPYGDMYCNNQAALQIEETKNYMSELIRKLKHFLTEHNNAIQEINAWAHDADKRMCYGCVIMK